MKKNILLLLLVFCGNVYSQKKKKATPKAPTSEVIAKSNDLSAEIVKSDFYLFRNEKGAKKDTLLLKTFTEKVKPTECVITPFVAKGIPLYCITWKENKKTDTKMKKEDINISIAQIWNPATKIQLYNNVQTSSKIKEQVFLDKLKTASETQERIHNDGYAFSLLPNGDIVQKGKSSETKFSLNPTTMKFEILPKTSSVSSKKRK
jgi:hypothetical protein